MSRDKVFYVTDLVRHYDINPTKFRKFLKDQHIPEKMFENFSEYKVALTLRHFENSLRNERAERRRRLRNRPTNREAKPANRPSTDTATNFSFFSSADFFGFAMPSKQKKSGKKNKSAKKNKPSNEEQWKNTLKKLSQIVAENTKKNLKTSQARKSN